MNGDKEQYIVGDVSDIHDIQVLDEIREAFGDGFGNEELEVITKHIDGKIVELQGDLEGGFSSRQCVIH